MIQTILNYYIEIILSLSVTFIGVCYRKIKKSSQDQNLVKVAMINMLGGSIIKSCGDYIEKGYCPMHIKEMVRSQYKAYSDLGGDGQASGNPLPTGVTLFDDTNNCLLTGPIDGNYGGNSNKYIYKVNTTSDVQFYVNPTFAPYNGSFTPSYGGVSCHLVAKVFAKYGITYSWKRTA